MLKMTIDIDMGSFLARLNGLREQVPFATAVALTKTAQQVKKDLRAAMAALFEAPSNFTLNSDYIERATKTSLTAYVGVKKGALSWERPEIYGGPRQQALEKSLAPLGLPPAGMWVLPGAGAKFTSGKHVSVVWVRKIVAQIQANAPSNQGKKRSRFTRNADSYFVLTQKTGRLAPGIYYRASAHHVLTMLVFVRPPRYRAKFNFYRVAENSARRSFPVEFEKAIATAVATAR